MKKLLCSLLVAAMMLSLCACGITDLNIADILGKEESNHLVLGSDSEITLNAYEVTLYTGETFQLNGYISAPKTLRWKSSNENVALVNSNGLVTASGEGIANITCYASGAIEAICTVTVKELDAVTPSATPTSPKPSYSTNTSGFIFPHSSYAYLTVDEMYATLSNMTGYSPANSYSQDAINEIYARNGYVFQNTRIAAYYNSQSWYYPNPDFKTSDLNKYEQANVALLQEYHE